MGLLSVLFVLGLGFALASAQCSAGQTPVTVLNSGAPWTYTIGANPGSNWYTSGFPTSGWATSPSPFSTPVLANGWSYCQQLNPSLVYQSTLTEVTTTPLIHYYRTNFNLAVSGTVASLVFQTAHDDSIDAVYINGALTGSVSLGYSCNYENLPPVTNLGPLNLGSSNNVLAVQWTNNDRAAYFDFKVVACVVASTCSNVTLSNVGSTLWQYTTSTPTGTTWATTGFNGGWASGLMPFATPFNSAFSTCQQANPALPPAATTISATTPLRYYLRSEFDIPSGYTPTAIYFRVVNDDDLENFIINGVPVVPIGSPSLFPSYSCTERTYAVTDLSGYSPSSTKDTLGIIYENNNGAGYLLVHIDVTLCTGLPTPSTVPSSPSPVPLPSGTPLPSATPVPSPSAFPQSGADPYFQDSHGHGFYANTEGLMLLCKSGRYTLQGHALAACNASFLMSTTVWENDTIPLSPECSRVKLQPGEGDNIAHAMLGNPFSIVRKEFCVVGDFKYQVYHVQVKPCGLVTQYVILYEDCEEGWMSHKTYELSQYYAFLED